MYINPEITILRGNKVPEDFSGIVFDIGRGAFDHHQKDSRIRENGIPYAAFGLLWDAKGGSDDAFFQVVRVAGMILENKFERYRGNERADKRVEELLQKHDPADRILILPEFIPCQKALVETDIAFVIFPSNRGGYCI